MQIGERLEGIGINRRGCKVKVIKHTYFISKVKPRRMVRKNRYKI